jgi:asparagine synthase (glutamine-hydrolysing)
MCGIAGIWNLNGAPVDPALLIRMRDSLAHRGPDGASCAVFSSRAASEPLIFQNLADLNAHGPLGDVGLAIRRLSIIDLVTGDQPISNEDGSVWIVFNGEIYNYRELRQVLEQAGHVFRTASDTEVVVHAYEQYGLECAVHLNGIFAFAIWDVRRRRLFLARDHFGVKPLYFSTHSGAFRFGSELKAILADTSVPRDVDPDALNLCLTLRYTPSPWTMLRGIRKLPPGSYALVDTAGAKVERYWTGAAQGREHADRHELTQALRQRLDRAVHRQMVSDVPISLSLSSGIDSSTLLAIMTRHSTEPVRTFTVGFAGREDESEIGPAIATARRFGARPEGQLISADDYAAFMSRYMWHLEEPIGNESAPAYYFVAQMAHRHGIKVMLNGQGPDEVFAGYSRHVGVAYASKLAIVPESLAGSTFVPLVDHLPLPETARRFAYALTSRSEVDQMLSIYTFVSPATRAALLSPRTRRLIDPDLPRAFVEAQLKAAPAGTRLERMLHVDTRTSLPDNLLLCEDKMAMAASVEARVPFLDLEFMQLAEMVPGYLKLSWGRGKYLHRRVGAGFVPPEIVRRPKIGFTSAVDLWLREVLGQRLRGAVHAPDSLTTAYLEHETVDRLITEHVSRRRNHQRILFLLLSMEAWYQTFILRGVAA